MKQFTPIKVLTFSALFLASFSAFAMESDGKGEKQEKVDKELMNFITGNPSRFIMTNSPSFNKELTKLLEGGANPTGKIPTRAGYSTPLETALVYSSFLPDSVRILLEYTTADRLNSSGSQAFRHLINCDRTAENKLKMIDLFRKKGFVFKGKKLLCKICLSVSPGDCSNFEIAKKLVEDYGVRVDETNEPFGTPMHCLATNGDSHSSKELLQEIRLTRDLLLKYGASLDAKNNKNLTPYVITLDRTGYYYGKKLEKDSLISEYNEEFKAIFDPKQQ